MRKIESVNSAKCFVISAPSGAGKTTLERRLLADKPDVFYNSVSDTTREKGSDEMMVEIIILLVLRNLNLKLIVENIWSGQRFMGIFMGLRRRHCLMQ